MITATKKLPEDKVDDTINLIAVNGSRIKTYGNREIKVKIGRKAYTMPAIICDIDQDILGMDFLSKYKLGFEWDGIDQSELYLVDKKADIRKLLQTVTVPIGLQTTHRVVQPSSSNGGGSTGPSRQQIAAVAGSLWSSVDRGFSLTK